MALIDRRITLRVAVAAVVIGATMLSGCGRRGALEAPPSAAAVTDEDGAAKTKASERPDRPFILDGLI